MNAPSPFYLKVVAQIKKIPEGNVATYGQIARLAGKPHASRAVAWILHSSSRAHNLPWHRVLNSKGKISFPDYTDSYFAQKKRLQAEGVEFSQGDFLDLKKFQWKKSLPSLTRSRAPKRPNKSR
jgi:methylated-DNA-protein-cysteine methyltransferase-like protein